MANYLNTETKEYPRHDGDLNLLGWSVGEPLPKNWVEVEYVDPPARVDDLVSDQLEPAQDNDGIWRMQWSELRPLTAEEIAEHAAVLKMIEELNNRA